jgi:Flp pilus assembly protein TadD
MDTHDPAPFLAEGEARLTAEDWDGAVAAFHQAVKIAPTSALAHSKLGVALVHKRQWDDAAGEFTQAIELDPTYAPAHSNLGNVHRERGRLDEAIASYTRAIALDPDYWVAHQNLGIVYKQQGRIAEAVQEFKTATRLSLRAPRQPTLGAGPDGARGRRLGCLSKGAMVILLGITGCLAR